MKFTETDYHTFDCEWVRWPRRRLWHWGVLGRHTVVPEADQRRVVYNELRSLMEDGYTGRSLRDTLRKRLEVRGFSPLLILSVLSVIIQLIRLVQQWRNS